MSLSKLYRKKDKWFLNLTNHQLTDSQIEAIKDKLKVPENRIVNFEEFKLWRILRSTPSNKRKLKSLSIELLELIVEFSKDKGRVYVHLPVGSPAFMFIFSQVVHVLPGNVTILFSHTERISSEYVDKEGNIKKSSIFQFVEFIRLSGAELVQFRTNLSKS